MTLPFNEIIINDGEINEYNFKYPNFVGYLNKLGEIIDYSNPFGNGHQTYNRITSLFLDYFDIYNLKKSSIMRESVTNEMAIIKMINNRLKSKTPYDVLMLDLITFFDNCYQNDLFMNGLGKDYYIMTKEEYYNTPEYQNILKKYPRKTNENLAYYKLRIPATYDFDYMYWKYKMSIILPLFKEIIISYLGYHSVERITKTITTSEIKIYSTFYNYLLNNFTIVRLPKMNFNQDKKMYVEYYQEDFYLPDSELRLKEEIQTIKKMVPSNELYKYYI